MTTCAPEQLAKLLPRALSGELVLAPVAESARAATLAMLQPELPVTEPDAALIVATSGSTGTPKGVVLSRRALLAAAQMAQQVTGPLAWTLALPAHYVAGAMVSVRAAVAGTPVTMCRSDLSDLAVAKVPSAISIVPTQLHRALSEPKIREALASYQVVLLGGAAVSADDLERGRSAGINLVTTYGMSETCGGCVWDGVPLPGVEVHLDPDGRVRLAGAMTFSGYRLRPELTAQTLVGDMVLTQDRARWRDGRLELLGRIDDVVISGGINVDLAEVERRIMALTSQDAAVIGVPDAEWGTRVVLASTDPRSLDQWRAALREPGASPTLEDAALPRQLLYLDRLPRTTSGKIDRRKLIELAQSQA